MDSVLAKLLSGEKNDIGSSPSSFILPRSPKLILANKNLFVRLKNLSRPIFLKKRKVKKKKKKRKHDEARIKMIIVIRQVRRAGIRGAEEQIEVQKSIHAASGWRRLRWRLEIYRAIHIYPPGIVGTSRTRSGHRGRGTWPTFRHFSTHRLPTCDEKASGIREGREKEEGGATAASRSTTSTT